MNIVMQQNINQEPDIKKELSIDDILDKKYPNMNGITNTRTKRII